MVPAIPLGSFRVEVCPWILPGKWLGGVTHGVIYVRHLSEFFAMCAGATWHVEAAMCPTWTDAAECRCMTEPQP